MAIFRSDQGENADFCLKLAYIEYLINFFNDHNFRVETHANTVPSIIQQSSLLLAKLLVLKRANMVN